MQKTRFPAPIRLTPGCTRWRLSDIEKYEEQELGRRVETLTPADERYLSDKQVAARFGVSRQTPWRWAKARGDAR